MRAPFTLFQSHLDLAHRYWSALLSPEDIAIDATCGNGHDAVFLASLGVKLYALDIQKEALDEARRKMEAMGVSSRVSLIKGCHSRFPEEIAPGSVKLIVYNLGYLPGGDKSVTTEVPTTLKSVQRAAELLTPGGVISITCYPGHPEGKNEEEQLLLFAQALDPKRWSCCRHQWVNRKNSPSLLLIQRSGDER